MTKPRAQNETIFVCQHNWHWWLLFVSILLANGCVDIPSASNFDERQKPPAQVSERLVASNRYSEDSLNSGVSGLPNPFSVEQRNDLEISANSYSLNSDTRPPILAIQTKDTVAFGVPIGLFSDQTLLMRNDGAIQRINNSDVLRQAVLQDRFRSIDRTELAQQLRSEFGMKYLVRNEAPYLIVARSEHMEAWAQRFRSIQHSFKLYCRTHGLTTREIEFPLVAIVFGSRIEFERYAAREGTKLPEFCVGYYFTDSNRILLYESPNSTSMETQMTICHEATHQLAFNTGLHQRRAESPLWLVEGLATMFESPMLSGLQSRDGKSLWPSSRKKTWQNLSKRPEAIQRVVANLIHNDLAFESDFDNAYSVSWAMTTFLSQRRSQQFEKYLNRIGGLPPFQSYDAAERVADFQRVFGTDPKLLTNKMITYLDSLQ